MAARTGVELGDTWSCKLNLLSANANTYNAAPMNTLGIGAMGCTASISKRTLENPDGYQPGPAQEHALNDPPPIPGQMGVWAGRFNCYNIQVYGPGLSNGTTIPLYIWIGDVFGMQAVPAFPTGTIVCTDSSYTLDVSISVSGLFLKGQMEDLSQEGRNILDFTDEAIDYKWYADENTVSTITGTGPGFSETFYGDWGEYVAGDEVDILVGETFGISYSIGSNWGINGARHGSISDIKWGSIGTIGCNGIEKLYSTNGSTWSRTVQTGNYWKFYDGNEISIVRYGANTTTDSSWTGWTMAPYIVEYLVDGDSTGNFDEDGEAVSLTFLSNYIVWDDEDTYHLEPVSNGLIVTQAASEWNEDYPNEWQKLTSRNIIVYEREAERVAYYEDLGEDEGMAQDDAQCRIPIPPLDATELRIQAYGNCFWANFGSVVHAESQSVNDPDTINRPSLWESTSVTVDGTNNDLWTLGVNSTDNIVHRDLKTRYYRRMERLSGGYTPGDEYGETWIWSFKSNLDLDDDPDWETEIPEEDLTNWTNYNYFTIDLDSEIAGTITMKIDYSVPIINDPFYTCASYRWEEFECTYETYSLSWTFDVEIGNNSILFDKTINDDGVDPYGSVRPQIVDTITFYLPDNPDTENTYDITLNDILLTLDTTATTNVEIRSKRNWKWYENYSIGIHGYVDGIPAIEVDYGYSVNKEFGIPSTQRREHCPTTQDQSSRLDTARPASQFMDIAYQEGWDGTSLYTTVLNSTSNKDEDGNLLCSAFYFWDIRPDYSQRTARTTYFNGCKTVGTYKIPAGKPVSIWVVKHPRGRLNGIAYNAERTERLRNTSDAVNIWGRVVGGNWALVQSGINTDQHGRFITWGLREKNWTYNYNGTSPNFTVYTREYTTVNIVYEELTMPHFVEGPMGSITLSYVNLANDKIYSKRKMGPKADWKDKVYVRNGFYPCLTMGKKNVMAYQTTESNIAFVKSKKFGTVWEDIGVAQIGTHPSMVDKNGIQYLINYIPGVGQVIKRSQDYFVTKMSYDPNDATQTSSLITASSDQERAAFIRLTTDGNHLIVAVPAYGSIVLYQSKNSGKDWEEIV